MRLETQGKWLAEDRICNHLVLFGATGDLATRMLLPSLYFLDLDGLLPDDFRVTGVSRLGDTAEAILQRVQAGVSTNPRSLAVADDSVWRRFAARFDYLSLDVTQPEDLQRLADRIPERSNCLFFLALSPSLFGRVCRGLEEVGLVRGGSRVVLEKPLGRDLATCRQINEALAEVFSEEQIFRIDHYLGKETVQNLIALRFGNAMFEPLWNNLSIDHVQITIAETQSVGGRWPYYDEYGALRDMVQNHLLQLVCLIAMEPPSNLDPEAIRNEKVKVLRCLRAIGARTVSDDTVRGQYAPGYREDRGADSDTETYVAIRASIDNWRWSGVPFYLRTGKALADRRTEIAIQFKDVPHSVFEGEGQLDLSPNRLIIRLQPEENISLQLMSKMPGLTRDGMRLSPVTLDITQSDLQQDRRIAYERLLLDAIEGNSTLFVGRSEVEQAWRWVDGIIEGWSEAASDLEVYPSGSWGPDGGRALVERDGRSWRD
jgi:glucose-6-phosphate 1-dehydrogenase